MKSRLAHLEGLRGIAALIVLFNHLQLLLVENGLNELLRYFEESTNSYLLSHIFHGSINVFFNGEFAIYIFWFLSAYVISIKLFTENDRSYLVRAFTKRYFRLAIPVIVSVLFAYLLLSLGLMYNQKVYGSESGAWISEYYLFDPNLFTAIKSGLWNTFFSPGRSVTYNPVLWTMNPELYGSMFIFLLFGIIGNNKYRFLFYVALALGTFFQANYWMLTFILGLALNDLNYGSKKTTLHTIQNRILQNQIINLLLFLVLLILGGFPNYYEFFYVGLSGLIVLVILKTKRLQSFFQHRLFVWLGKISFGLYLIHFPIIASFSSYLYIILPLDYIPKIITVFILSTILSLVLAHWFAKFVDQFAIKFSNKIGNSITLKDDRNLNT